MNHAINNGPPVREKEGWNGNLPAVDLAVTTEGIPVRVWCWPGNTTDTSVLPAVLSRA